VDAPDTMLSTIVRAPEDVSVIVVAGIRLHTK
jgi:hypothetical protein